MKKFIMIIAVAVSSVVLADKPTQVAFEINKENCNLPVQKIRELIPGRAQQEKIYRACIKKAVKEKWNRRDLQLSSQ